MSTAGKVAVLMIFSTSAALALAAQGKSTAPDPTQPVIIGVLEDVPGHSIGQPHVRAVRAVFEEQGDKWLPFPSNCSEPGCLRTIVSKYPSEITWTITFDGRNLGKIKSHTPTQFEAYSDIGLEPIAAEEGVPVIGKRNTEFSGYLGEPVYRPLVVNSRTNFKDPEEWRPSQVSSELAAIIRRQFRNRFPAGSRCDQGDPTDDRLLTYPDEDIKLEKAYSSKNGRTVAKMQLSQYLCSGDPEHNFPDQWFVAKNGEATFLGEGLQLVDAGDYDNDGKSELIFSISRDNRGGYELFYDDFKKRAVFEFSYH